MNTRNNLLFTLVFLPSVQLYGMITQFQPNNSQPLLSTTLTNNTPTLKRPSENPINFTGVEKKARTEDPQPLELPLSTKIKKTMYNFDPIALGNILITNEAAQLSKDQKEELHIFAKTHKTNVKEMRAMGHKIANQSDSQEIKTKFSYDSEYENMQKISRYLYAFKTLPKLTFPQAFFTKAPYVKDLQPKTTPDQALIALIKNEQEKISVCCYHITLDTISQALVHKKKQGISVDVVTNLSQGDITKTTPNPAKEIDYLIKNEIPIWWPNKTNYQQMHHKFFVFERNVLNKSILVTGSYNPTPNGNNSSWDDIIILEDPDMTTQYLQRIEEIKNRSETFQKKT